MLGLKRMLEQQAEKEQKKKEKELLRLEKRKKKEEERERKKAERKKEQARVKRILYNRRYYQKKRLNQLDERKRSADVHGYCMVCIMKNRKKTKRLGLAWWRNDAMKVYNEAIKINREQVRFPIIYEEGNDKENHGHSIKEVLYEILLVQKMGNNEDNTRKLKDENTGKFVDNLIIDNEYYAIIAKAPFFMEEKFYVYGYNPRTERKDFNFIIDEIFTNRASRHDGMKRVFLYGNKLVQQYDDDDFDFIVAKNKTEAERLYNEVEKELNGRDGFLFLQVLADSLVPKFVDLMKKKTGWNKRKIYNSSNL